MMEDAYDLRTFLSGLVDDIVHSAVEGTALEDNADALSFGLGTFLWSTSFS